MTKVTALYEHAKGIIYRVIFIVHALLALYFVYMNDNKNNTYFFLLIPIIFMLLEGLQTVYVKAGMEYDYIWPSGLLYIATIIPMIWIIELDLFDRTRNGGSLGNNVVNNTLTTNTPKKTGLLEVFSDIEIVGKKWCEIGLFLVLILGRWCMPRGNLSRDQFSALMLNFVGITPDIMDLMDSLEVPKITRSDVLAVLVIYTIATLQFTLTTTSSLSSLGSSKPDPSSKKGKPNSPAKKGESLNKAEIKKSYGEKSTEEATPLDMEAAQTSKKEAGEADDDAVEIKEASDAVKRKQFNMYHCVWNDEFYQIFVTIFMHNGPFFFLRLYLCIEYNVINELHIFFLVQNGIIISLLVHRIFVLCCDFNEDVLEVEQTITAEGYFCNDLNGNIDNDVGEKKDALDEVKREDMLEDKGGVCVDIENDDTAESLSPV